MARKKKKQAENFVWLILLFLVIGSALLYYFKRPRFVRYPAFGIELPTAWSIHGIDVSHYQSTINWNEVKAMQVKNIKIHFAFIKATEGINNIDKRFKPNWKGAQKAGLVRGAYHFFNPYKSGKVQALHFIRQVNLLPGDLPPVLDVEDAGQLDKATLRQMVKEWLQEVEQHYGVKPIIYTGADFYKYYLNPHFDEYPLWVAHYLVKDKPRVKRHWHFWQHNERGRVNGINAYVDFNVYNGDSAAFSKLLYK